jgi:hypothetical protein
MYMPESVEFGKKRPRDVYDPSGSIITPLRVSEYEAAVSMIYNYHPPGLHSYEVRVKVPGDWTSGYILSTWPDGSEPPFGRTNISEKFCISPLEDLQSREILYIPPLRTYSPGKLCLLPRNLSQGTYGPWETDRFYPINFVGWVEPIRRFLIINSLFLIYNFLKKIFFFHWKKNIFL